MNALQDCHNTIQAAPVIVFNNYRQMLQEVTAKPINSNYSTSTVYNLVTDVIKELYKGIFLTNVISRIKVIETDPSAVFSILETVSVSAEKKYKFTSFISSFYKIP